jgi:hypothetical protein
MDMLLILVEEKRWQRWEWRSRESQSSHLLRRTEFQILRPTIEPYVITKIRPMGTLGLKDDEYVLFLNTDLPDAWMEFWGGMVRNYMTLEKRSKNTARYEKQW